MLTAAKQTSNLAHGDSPNMTLYFLLFTDKVRNTFKLLFCVKIPLVEMCTFTSEHLLVC